jgi:AAA family ATP:ADP antiporter
MKGALFKGCIDSSVAELMPFLKVGAVLPGALFFTFLFTQLISRFNRNQVFYIIISGFMVYFALFLFVLYPNNELLRLDAFADFLKSNIIAGSGFSGVIEAIRHLNLTVFYVACEMWSIGVLTMLCWGYANEVTKVDEAKRFYAIFALAANSSGIFSGQFGQRIGYITSIPMPEIYRGNEWIFLQISFVLVVAGLILVLFHWLNTRVYHLEQKHAAVSAYVKPKKLSLMESLHYVRKSKYLMYMVVIVVGYNIVFNLTDTLWMHKIEEVFGNGKDMNAYMNNITSITGYVAILMALLLSGNVIRTFGWTVTALITPIVWLCAGLAFYSGLVLEKAGFIEILSNITSNPANLVLLLGSIQISLGRGCKYTVFDETKEIAFVPLPKESQRKGKAVVDGLASRFGKSGGSIISIMLLAACGNISTSIPYTTGIMLIVLFAWLYATLKMGVIVNQAIVSGGDLKLEEEIPATPTIQPTANTAAAAAE